MICSVRVPFDNVVLSAVVGEIQPFLGGFVQEIRQPDETTVALQIYRRLDGAKGMEGMLLLSCHPQFARCHFITRRLSNSPKPPVFCATLRARIQGAELVSAAQVACDRILRLTFLAETGTYEVIAELMGKHSNLILIESNLRIVSACKWVPRFKSVRAIQPNEEYRWPPVIRDGLLEHKPVTTPSEWLDFRSTHPEAVSKFFRELPITNGDSWAPSRSTKLGAYPFSLQPIDPQAVPIANLSIGLEQFFAHEEAVSALESLRASLLGQMQRVLQSRAGALADLAQTLASGQGASKWQLYGELILAYGAALPEKAELLDAYDYDGNSIQIPLDPELDFKENANRLFDKAKRAKGRASTVQDSYDRLAAEQSEIEDLKFRVESANRYDALSDLREIARSRRWLTTQVVAKGKEDRPYEGHKIRELVGPGGFRVLYGDNAESNDYLTLRVAKPNDYWLHVRGSTSAHVVVQTLNQPEKIGKEHLMFAAKIAVLNSPSKHAGYVPVDYTLKKYVRKPRGAPKGTAIYTNEKTVHVES